MALKVLYESRVVEDVEWDLESGHVSMETVEKRVQLDVDAYKVIIEGIVQDLQSLFERVQAIDPGPYLRYKRYGLTSKSIDLSPNITMFAANTYKIMIGCPGDIREEKDMAIKVINRWTIRHAEQFATVLLPIHWSTSSYPEHGAHPQTLLNGQLVSKSDMLIGIFGARIGSPTDKSISGTIEEIEEHIKDEKPVMLFFRRQNDTSTIPASEIEKLQAFKATVKNHYLYSEYDSPETFETTFTNALELFLANNWLSGPKPKEVSNSSIELSDEQVSILKSWIDSNDPDAHTAIYKGGTVFILGRLSYDVTEGRELVQWREFFNKLKRAGFIEQYRTNRQGNPVYQLRAPAYDFIDKLEKHEK